MPDRKKLLQDFYAKYAPEQEVSDERLKAIDAKYGQDNDRLLQDFYAKYAPNEQVTPERLDAIYNKYGLKKKEPTQSAGALGVTPSRSASSGDALGGSFADVLQQSQPLQQPTARPKQESDFVKGMRGGDVLGQSLSREATQESEFLLQRTLPITSLMAQKITLKIQLLLRHV